MKPLAVAAALALVPASASTAPLGPFSGFFVFGDSLSDPGNVFDMVLGAPVSPLPGLYAKAQFADGDAWAAQLGADFASGANFAFGGATAVMRGEFEADLPGGTVKVDVPDFADQRALFNTASPTLGANPLAAVWFGGNDLRDAFDAPTPGTAVPAAIASAAAAIAAGVQELIDEGLGTVAVFGLPNLGRIPEIVGRGSDAMAAAAGASVAFNDTLRTALTGVSGGDVAYVDIFGLFEAVAADPGAYDLTDVTGACIPALLADPTTSCETYLFYDEIHPTSAGHALITDLLLDTVAPVPLPAGGALLLAGLGGLAVFRRRSAQP